MLVLTRKRNEAICMFKDGKLFCRIVNCRTESGRVSIGIEADRNIGIYREEFIERWPEYWEKRDFTPRGDFTKG